MKWLLGPLLLSVFALTACGGASPPTPTPTPALLSSPSPTPSPVADCNGALPEGNIAFRGRIVSLEAPTPTARNTIRGVLVELLEVHMVPGSGFDPAWFVPNAQLWFSLSGDNWPEFLAGECVAGTGHIEGFSCGDACDAARFVADSLEKS
jgi:hypothetical protein